MMMTLLNDATSPFGRKVLVAAIERSLDLREEFVDLAEPASLRPFNPLWQIPVLVTGAGEAVYDSAVITLYLDTMHEGEALVPDRGRFAALTAISLCDGLMEAVLQRVLETRRPEGERSQGVIDKLEARIGRALAALDRLIGDRGPGFVDAVDIAAYCALEYVDFRFSTAWRQACPAAAAWLASHAERPSLRLTRPTRTSPVSSAREAGHG